MPNGTSSKTAMLCLSLFITTSTLASTQVLEYQTANGSVSSFTVPIDNIRVIVTKNNYAWAIGANFEVSFFDGTSWHSPTQLSTITGIPGKLTAYTSGLHSQYAMAQFDPTAYQQKKSNKYQQSSTTSQLFTINANKQYQWLSMDDINSQGIANGRMWNYTNLLQERFDISSGVTGSNMTAVQSDANRQIVYTAENGTVPGYYAYYDAQTDTDYFYAYSLNDPLTPNTDDITLATCSVSHQSTNPGTDVVCKSQQVDTKKLIPSMFGPTNYVSFQAVPYGPTGAPMFFIDTTSNSKNMAAVVWSQNNGQDWIATTPFNYQTSNNINMNFVNRNCTVINDTSTSNSLQFACVDLTDNAPSPIAPTIYTVKTNSSTASSYNPLISQRGIWLSDTYDNILSFYSFSTKQSQQLPKVPGNTDLQKIILSNPSGTADEVVACSDSPYQDGTQTKTGVRFQIASLDNSHWQWTSPNISTPLAQYKECKLSTLQTKRGQESQMSAKPQTIWAYPTNF